MKVSRSRWCLPAHGGHVGAAGMAIPGAVGISGQATLCTGLAIQLALVQGQLGHTLPGAHKQPLLEEEAESRGRDELGWRTVEVGKKRRIIRERESKEIEVIQFAPVKQRNINNHQLNHPQSWSHTSSSQSNNVTDRDCACVSGISLLLLRLSWGNHSNW